MDVAFERASGGGDYTSRRRSLGVAARHASRVPPWSVFRLGTRASTQPGSQLPAIIGTHIPPSRRLTAVHGDVGRFPHGCGMRESLRCPLLAAGVYARHGAILPVAVARNERLLGVSDATVFRKCQELGIGGGRGQGRPLAKWSVPVSPT